MKQIVLGDKLPNPYSLSVMQRAADELAENSSLKSAQPLQATHHYVRFAPRDTWAGGIAWFLTGKVYELNIFNAHLHYVRGSYYTGLIRDLIDDDSDDPVTGFTITQIETALKKNTTWESLKAYLKTLKVAKDEDIDAVFANW